MKKCSLLSVAGLLFLLVFVSPMTVCGQDGGKSVQEKLMAYKWYPDIYDEDEEEYSFWVYSMTNEIDSVYIEDELEVYSVRYYLSDKVDTVFDESKVGKVSSGKYVITESGYDEIPALAYEILELTDKRLVVRFMTPGMTSYMNKMILYAAPLGSKENPLR